MLPPLAPRSGKPRRACAALVALLLGAASSSAWALGLGRGPSSALMGSGLDFQVPLRLDPGESLSAECVSAEVLFGEAMVPRARVLVSVGLTPGNESIRVRTTSTIDEPLVTVSVTAGCDAKVTRRFTLLADPPVLAEIRAPLVAAAPPPGPAPAAAAAAAAQPPAPAESAGLSAPPSAPPSASQSAPPSAPPTAPAPGPSAAPPASTGAPPAPPAPSVPPAATASRAAPEAAKGRREANLEKKGSGPTGAPTGQAAASADKPRLKLDGPAAPKSAATRLAEQETALKAAQDAALAAEAAASAAQARAASLEKTLEALRQEAKANSEAVARLTAALSKTQPSSDGESSLWMGAAGALLLLGAGLGVALWRRRRVEAAEAWSAQGEAAEVSPREFSASVEPVAAAPEGQPGSASAPEPAAVPIELAPAATVPPGPDAPVSQPPAGSGAEVIGSGVSAPMRNVSVEELLDLEQQVEFFAVLGQDEPAVELLLEHIRKTGGTHPLPYLKMLEIYRRMGDRDSYERTRTRFNQRFNAVAPAFDAPAGESKMLEDYAVAMGRIQKSWSRPVDAMAILENMLVRSEGREGFGVEALAEVLFLYTLARDVHAQQSVAGADASDVDVLIPFADSHLGAFEDSRQHPEGSGESKGGLGVNFDDTEEPAVQAAVPVQGPAGAFGITVGVEEEGEAPRTPAVPVAEAAPPAASIMGSLDIPLGPSIMAPLTEAAAPGGPQTDIPLGDSTMGPLDIPLGPSVMGPLDSAEAKTDIPLGLSVMGALDTPVDATLKGRSQLPLPAAREDTPSVDLELGGSMLGSLFESSAVERPAQQAAALPAIEINLDFEDPAAPPRPAPEVAPLEINLEGLELEPRPAPEVSPSAQDEPAPTPPSPKA